MFWESGAGPGTSGGELAVVRKAWPPRSRRQHPPSTDPGFQSQQPSLSCIHPHTLPHAYNMCAYKYTHMTSDGPRTHIPGHSINHHYYTLMYQSASTHTNGPSAFTSDKADEQIRARADCCSCLQELACLRLEIIGCLTGFQSLLLNLTHPA